MSFHYPFSSSPFLKQSHATMGFFSTYGGTLDAGVFSEKDRISGGKASKWTFSGLSSPVFVFAKESDEIRKH